jgi:flagellar basal-body rod modification protein FlgD
MAVTGVSSSGSGAASSLTGTTAKNTLSRQDFLNIMISEMSHQDPMNPVDNQQFLNQLAQLESLQATTALSDGIKSLLAVQQIGSASALIGKNVEGKDSDGNAVVGKVEKVVVQSGNASVVVNGTQLPLGNVSTVQA